jgi:hypothetical protein
LSSAPGSGRAARADRELRNPENRERRWEGEGRDGRCGYLHQEVEVDIVRLGRGALGPLVPAAGDEVDTLPGEEGRWLSLGPTVAEMSVGKGERYVTMAARGGDAAGAAAAAEQEGWILGFRGRDERVRLI